MLEGLRDISEIRDAQKIGPQNKELGKSKEIEQSENWHGKIIIPALSLVGRKLFAVNYTMRSRTT